MSEMFKPLLAATCKDVNKLRFPGLASPKLDGIRCLLRNSVPMSRKLKPIPNLHVQKLLSVFGADLDGELMVKGQDYNGVQSQIMSEDGEPDFTYYVFDFVPGEGGVALGYQQRLAQLERMNWPAPVQILESRWVENVEQLMEYEQECVDRGFEGVMFRSLNGRYKYGRSTENESILVKIKRFEDAEAQVIGFEEKMHNGNEAQKDELGHSKRSNAKAGLVGTGTLGALLVKYTTSGIEFSIGTGFNDAQRQEIWNNKEKYHGQMASFKYQEFSKYGVPRFPVFKGWRHD